MLQANEVLKRLGGRWMLQSEAQRSRVTALPPVAWPHPDAPHGPDLGIVHMGDLPARCETGVRTRVDGRPSNYLAAVVRHPHFFG